MTGLIQWVAILGVIAAGWYGLEKFFAWYRGDE